MIRLTLTDPERDAVRALRRDGTLHPSERDRVEMVLLADGGWGVPRIAQQLSCHPATVRGVLKRFRAQGLASLRRTRPGPPPDVARRQQVEAALTALLAHDRTWTAGQLATALAEEHGIRLSPRQTRKYLGRIAAWRRTARSLRHKQDPARVAHAKTTLDRLKKKPGPAVSAWSTSMRSASPPPSR